MPDMLSLAVPQIVPIASDNANLYEALKQIISYNNQLKEQITDLKARVSALEAG